MSNSADLLRENAGRLLGAMLGPPSAIAAATRALPIGRWAAALAGDAEAWRELAGRHWYGVYAWWRRAGLEPEGASAATSACFGRWMDEPPGDGGPLRESILAALATLAGNEALDRAQPWEIDTAWAEATYAAEPEGTPDAIFHRRWALTLLELAMATLRAEYEGRGQAALFAELTPFAGFAAEGGEPYETASGRLGLTTGAVRKAVFDFRTRHRELLRAFVADTVMEPAEIDREMTALLIACDMPGAELPAALRAFKPDELLARAMQTVRMTSGGAGEWVPPSDDEAARLFPQYEILGLLGRGGMGAVYKARQVALDRCVAIKLLPLEVSVDQEFAGRFQREARALAKLSHPNLIAVHDFGTTSEGHLFFVMEFIEGSDLAGLIHGPGLPPQQALELASQVCSALAYAHGKGIVHRDIKPANVLISREGVAKVADFGLARLAEAGTQQLGHTVTGMVMGTPEYMAPEQKRGMEVDQRADIYSVGVMLYEMLCGEVPQGAFEPPSQRAGCDPRIDPIVLKAMHRDPARRYQSTTEMKADVEFARTPLPVAAHARPAGSLSPGVQERPRRSRLLPAAAIVVLLAGLIGGAQYFKKGSPRPANHPPAAAASPLPLPPGALEAEAIRLWSSPEKLPPRPGVTWEDGAMKLDSVAGGPAFTGPAFFQPMSRNAILRVTVRAHADGSELRLLVRRSAAGNPNSYVLGVNPTYATVQLNAGENGRDRMLKQWPLPGAYRGTGWIPLELRAVEDEISVLVGNQLLGSVRDGTVSAAGGVTVSVRGAGFFRDIVYLPLDSPGSVAAGSVPGKATSASRAPGEVDLLAGVDVQRDSLFQPWRLEGGALKGPLNAGARSEKGHETIKLLTKSLPPSYDLRYRLTRETPGFALKFFFVQGNGGSYVDIDSAPHGNVSLERVGAPVSASTGGERWFRPGVTREVVLRVRESGVAVLLDGRQIIHAEGRAFRDGQKDYYANPDTLLQPPFIGLNFCGGALVVHEARLLPVASGGTPLPSTPAHQEAAAAPDAERPYENSLGMRFVPVPITGGPTGGQRVFFSIWHTRVQDYSTFVTENRYVWRQPSSKPRPADPAVMISWTAAQDFCQWLTQRDQAAGRLPPTWCYRLPSDHEWSCAVGLGDREDVMVSPQEKNRKNEDVYPWGSQWPPPTRTGNFAGEEMQPLVDAGTVQRVTEVLAGYRDDYTGTSPAGSFPANRFGIFDTAGNAWQWCEDIFDQKTGTRVLRGSSYLDHKREDLLASRRWQHDPAGSDECCGFRCVLAPLSSKPTLPLARPK